MPNPANLTAGSPETGLEVTYRFIGDRFHSAITALIGGEKHLLMSSIEGNDQEPWPPSPPLQECLSQSIGNQTILLGTGMAGQSHWSISIEAGSAPISLTWDVACRMKSTGDVGSLFSIKSPVESSSTSDIRFSPCGPCSIRLEPLLVGEKLTVCELKDSRLAVIPPRDHQQMPATLRWKYRIEIR